MCHNTSAGTVEKAITSRKATKLVAVPRVKLCVRGLLCLYGTRVQEPACLHPGAGTSLGGEAQVPFPAPPWENNPPTSVVLRCMTLIINSVLCAVHGDTGGELGADAARPDSACRCQQ